MVDKSELLRQMRKHAKTFSSAIGPPKEVDQKSINHALALIDLFAKESNYGSSRKLSINIPHFLKVLRAKESYYLLQKNPDKKNTSCFSGVKHLKNKGKKEKDKFRQAEKKLLKLLSTKNC